LIPGNEKTKNQVTTHPPPYRLVWDVFFKTVGGMDAAVELQGRFYSVS
jgi:hypothetical protein